MENNLNPQIVFDKIEIAAKTLPQTPDLKYNLLKIYYKELCKKIEDNEFNLTCTASDRKEEFSNDNDKWYKVKLDYNQVNTDEKLSFIKEFKNDFGKGLKEAKEFADGDCFFYVKTDSIRKVELLFHKYDYYLYNKSSLIIKETNVMAFYRNFSLFKH